MTLPGQVEAAPIPAEVFPGIEFDPVLLDTYPTGEGLLLQGQVADPSKANGQILFSFTTPFGGEPIHRYIDLVGTGFSAYQIFPHEQAGVYDLAVWLRGPESETLPLVGLCATGAPIVQHVNNE